MNFSDFAESDIIKGNFIQKNTAVTPENPGEIKHELFLYINENGKKKEIKLDNIFELKEGEYITKEKGKWYLHRKVDSLEILENFLKEMDELYNKTLINNRKEREALRFVLNDYKRLKEELNKVVFKNASIKIGDKDLKDILKNYILKSKVKEKIKELDETRQYWNKEVINILQELLKGE